MPTKPEWAKAAEEREARRREEREGEEPAETRREAMGSL